MLVEKNLVTLVPLKVAVEKLRGFVADHNAQIELLQENDIVLRMELLADSKLRRRGERPVSFEVSLHFAERRMPAVSTAGIASESIQSVVKVSVRPRKDRDRRMEGIADRANKIVSSLRSYLMATEEAIAPK